MASISLMGRTGSNQYIINDFVHLGFGQIAFWPNALLLFGLFRECATCELLGGAVSNLQWQKGHSKVVFSAIESSTYNMIVLWYNL